MTDSGQANGIQWRTTSTGKRRYRWVYNGKAGRERGPWGTHEEAVSGRRKLLGEVESGKRAAPSKLTLREAWEAFIEGAAAGTILSRNGKPFAPSTLRGYRQSWARLDVPLGGQKLTALRRRDLQKLIDEWVAAGASASTINNSLDPLRAIYNRAIRRDLVSVDPLKGLEIPKIDNKRERFATREEAAALIAALPSEDQAIWATALYAGLRHGELRGLRWSDVFWSSTYGPHVSVSRSWDEHALKGPKTDAGVRRVPMPKQLAAYLQAHKTATGRDGDDLIFGATADTPFAPTTVRRRAQRAWAAAGLTPIGLHECRHTYASLMIDMGANVKALSTAMGHRSIAITLDRYSKLMPAAEIETGRQFGEYLGD